MWWYAYIDNTPVAGTQLKFQLQILMSLIALETIKRSAFRVTYLQPLLSGFQTSLVVTGMDICGPLKSLLWHSWAVFSCAPHGHSHAKFHVCAENIQISHFCVSFVLVLKLLLLLSSIFTIIMKQFIIRFGVCLFLCFVLYFILGFAHEFKSRAEHRFQWPTRYWTQNYLSFLCTFCAFPSFL